jgi:hypothetical protein
MQIPTKVPSLAAECRGLGTFSLRVSYQTLAVHRVCSPRNSALSIYARVALMASRYGTARPREFAFGLHRITLWIFCYGI